MCQYSADDGRATDWHLIHLGHLALSGAALLTIEATAVTPEGRISYARPRPVVRRRPRRRSAAVLESVRRWSDMPIAIQLAHAGRKASTKVPWEGGGADPPDAAARLADGRAVGRCRSRPASTRRSRSIARDSPASARPSPRRRGAPRGSASTRCSCTARTATCCTSSSRRCRNQRDDEYGGSLENRMRFPLEVFDAVREAFPAERPVSVRVSGTDWAPGGWDIEQTVAFAQALEARGCAAIHVSSGGLTPAQKIPVGPGYQVPLARAVKQATSTAGRRRRPDHRVRAGRGDRRHRRRRPDRAGAGDPLRPALAVARGGALRRDGEGARTSTSARSRRGTATCSPSRTPLTPGAGSGAGPPLQTVTFAQYPGQVRAADCPRDRSPPVDRERRRAAPRAWSGRGDRRPRRLDLRDARSTRRARDRAGRPARRRPGDQRHRRHQAGDRRRGPRRIPRLGRGARACTCGSATWSGHGNLAGRDRRPASSARRDEAAAALRVGRADLAYATADLRAQAAAARRRAPPAERLDLSRAGRRGRRAAAQQAAGDARLRQHQLATRASPRRSPAWSPRSRPQEGETVAASFAAPTFVTLLDLARLEVRAYVDETDIGRIRRGQTASFTVDTYGDQAFDGPVDRSIRRPRSATTSSTTSPSSASRSRGRRCGPR